MTGSRDTVRDGGQDGGQDTIDLQDFLKISGVVDTGGEAKFRVQGGEVRLNGEIETRRRKKLRRGDIVEYAGEKLTVDW